METGDVIIIGSGPAAYTCAIYLKGRSVLLIEGGYVGNNGPGGQLTTTTTVDNYPCFPDGISGPDLVDLMVEHAAVATVSETASALTWRDNDDARVFEVVTEKGVHRARCVVIATGSAAKRLYVPGTHDNEFWNRGVSSCAVCDGWAFRDKVCCVIGGGDSAMEETTYIASIARAVYLVHRSEAFRARADMFARVQRLKNVTILTCRELVRATGTDKLEAIVLASTAGEEEIVIAVDGLFFGIGHVPNTSFLTEIDLSEGHVVTNAKMETSVRGVFACGDVQDKKYRQANTAAATGCIAALTAIDYCANH